MLDQGLHAAQGLGQGEKRSPSHEIARRLLPRRDREAHHAAEVAHLPRSNLMPRMGGQTWIEHAPHRRVPFEQLNDLAGVGAVLAHPYAECLDAA